MTDDFTSWRNAVELGLWLTQEPIPTEQEICRYWEAGLPAQAAVARIREDRQMMKETERRP